MSSCSATAIALLLSLNSALANTISPVETFHAGLIDMMKSSNYEQRLELLRPVVKQTFDTSTVARIALGRQWRKLPDIVQQQLTELMAEVIISSYASRFPIYTRQHFEIRSEQAVSDNRAIVRTNLLTGDDTVDLDYQLIESEDQWKIFDVVANGVSDLSLKRATYAETFKASGIEGVIEEIQQTIQANRTRADL